MSRLQKKCLVAIAGAHLFLVVLICCSGFIKPTSKLSNTQSSDPDNAPPLQILPPAEIEPLFKSGGKNSPNNPVAPPVNYPSIPQQHETQKLKLPTKLNSGDLVPAKLAVTPKVPSERKIHKADLANPAVKDANPEDQKRQQFQDLADDLARLKQDLNRNVFSATQVEIPNYDNRAADRYALLVKSAYESRWNPPEGIAKSEAATKVSVTIARDGHVIESHIIDSSDDPRLDANVSRTLDQVRFIQPFPDGDKANEKTFIINFALEANRSF